MTPIDINKLNLLSQELGFWKISNAEILGDEYNDEIKLLEEIIGKLTPYQPNQLSEILCLVETLVAAFEKSKFNISTKMVELRTYRQASVQYLNT
jgi:predicted house-cleaning noncanonical NTP pyrophosphatase (MazG superfamily)